MKDLLSIEMPAVKAQQGMAKKRRASEPFTIPWKDGESFKLSEDYLRTFYLGKRKLDDHPYWSYNKCLIGNKLIMELRGGKVYGMQFTVTLFPEHLIVTCDCNTEVEQLCAHVCSAMMYRVRSAGKYFAQFYIPEYIALSEDQQRLFDFELNSYHNRDKVGFLSHPEYGRIFGYRNQRSYKREWFDNPIQLLEPITPRLREAKLVFGIPIRSHHFHYPILLPYLTKTGTKTAKTNPYASFDRSYLLTGEEAPESLSIHERSAEAACRNMLQIVEQPTDKLARLLIASDNGSVSDFDDSTKIRLKKALLMQAWAEFVPHLQDNVKVIFFDGYQSSPSTTKPSAGSRYFRKLKLAPVKLKFDLAEQGNWFQLKLSLFVNDIEISNPQFLGEHFSCFLECEGTLVYFIPDVQDEEIIHQFRQSEFVITVLSQDFQQFLLDILMPISNRYSIHLNSLENSSYFARSELRRGIRRLRIEEQDSQLFFRPNIDYSPDFTVNPMQEANLIVQNDKDIIQILHRDKELEGTFATTIGNLHSLFEQQYGHGFFWLSATELGKTTWLQDCVLQLQDAGVMVDVMGLREGTPHFPRMLSWEMNILKEDENHYYAKINAKMGSMPIILDVLRDMVTRSKNWFKLEDGTFGVIGDEDKAWLRPLFAVGKIIDGGIVLPTSHFNTLERYSDYISNPSIKLGIEVKRQKLIALEAIEQIDKPSLVKAILRPYQQAGLSWLVFLREFGWGGILADDMGLGKTLQVISVLEHYYQQQPNAPASLIVMPNSLLFNWESEFSKFAPYRELYIHHGAERHDVLKRENGLIILTTYGTLIADVDLFTSFELSYLILDESQSIKNRNSKRYEAAQRLNPRYRIAMTGTPIENGIADLYAQLSFVNPGFFGTFSDFKRTYPGIADGSAPSETKAELQRVISPFILRRTKKQVARELPDKSEMLLYCEMLPEQRTIYEEYRSLFRSRLVGSFENNNDGRSKFLAIEGLMKLRQICNSPALLKDGIYPNTSAKLDELMEQISELLTHHKILIFSSFTSMLSLLEERLTEIKVGYAYLDGKTSGDNRQAQVRLFQEDENCRLFLLSLKAGGTGLNLTAADYVYILDPWWNPAAEAQAIDRCYRIGQDKHVMAYRMICKDSIEEKILNMQASKKELAESLIQTDGNILKALNREDLLKLFE